MKKPVYLVLLSALLTAGCVELPGRVARTQSVGGLPPEIDPKLPAVTKPVSEPAAAKSVEKAAEEKAAAPTTDLPFQPAVAETAAVRPEQVTAANAHEMANRLAEELDQAAQPCVRHGTENCPHCRAAGQQ